MPAGAASVPLFDLTLTEEDLDAVEAVLRSGWLTMGPRTEEWEATFAAHLGARHAVAVSSCTAALHVAYLAAGVGPGTEVIVPSITFAATATAAIYCGATPVFADVIGQEDPGIDPAHVEALITDRTRAVCGVHFAGYPAAAAELEALCDRHGVAFIEDVAHAPSATLGDGRRLGTIGLAGCFSFFSNKVLSCGEGGLLATDDDEVARIARLHRSQGMTSGTWSRHLRRTDHYDAVALGHNYRFDEGRAALLLSRFKRLEDDIARRRDIVRRYRRGLGGLDGLVVPYRDEDVDRSSCYVMPVFVRDADRQVPLRRHLREQHSIQTSLLYPCIHEFSAYLERFGAQSLPGSERHARTEVTLPLFPGMDDALVDRVVEAVAEGLERA